MDGSSNSPLHDPASMREVLQRHLGQPDDSTLCVRECRIANTRRRDGSRGTVEYELSLERLSSGQTWEQRVTGVRFAGDRTRRVWESLRQANASGVSRDQAPGLPAFAYVPELDLLLQVFPHDYRLPALAELMAGPPSDLVPHVLAEFGDGVWELAGWSAEPVQYRVDMRAILRLKVQAHERAGTIAERQFYAKVYRDAAMCRRASDVQRAISERAAETRRPPVAARVIAHLEGLRSLVTASLPGISLSKIIRRGDAVIPAVQAAARATAELHQLNVAAPPRPLGDDIARLREAEAFLVSERPDLAPVVLDLARSVIDRLADAPAALIHGDLKPDHILVDGSRVAFIDFDLAAAADPAIDVAHLVAFLATPQARARARGRTPVNAAEVFVNEYFAHVPPSWRERLPAYHALMSMHKAVGLCRRRGDEGQDRIEGVLREGQALLAADGGDGIPSYKRRMTRSAVR